MKALVLSGGGSNGAWQEGVLRYLIEVEPLARLVEVFDIPFLRDHLGSSLEKLQPLSHVESMLDILLDAAGKDVVNALRKPYEVICGVSVGALNGSVLTEKQGDSYSIYESYRKLADIWDGVTPKRIRKRWFPFGKLHALWEPALFNSKPLQQLIRSNLTIEQLRGHGIELRIGAVSLTTGKYRGFTQDDPEIVEAVAASAAYPIFFLPVQIGDDLWTDGGARDIVPLTDAIRAGATEIDVVVCQPLEADRWTSKAKTINLAGRTLELMTTELVVNDIMLCNRITAAVLAGHGHKDEVAIKLRVFAPLKGVGDGLNFDPDEIARRRAQGFKDAQETAAGLQEDLT